MSRRLAIASEIIISDYFADCLFVDHKNNDDADRAG